MGYSCTAHLRAIVEPLACAQTRLAGRNSDMLDFWKKSENNTRFSIIVLGICLIVLVALLTRL